MFRNKPVKSRTIWISLLTSVFYLAIRGEVISAFAVTPQNISRQNIAQADTESDLEKPKVEEAEAENTLEKAIIAELNRVRTNPQGYADWLESQKQYYQGMLLKLPGEQPIRTNRGLRSLEEAITFLRQQQQLPALSTSTELISAARQQITAITNNRQVNNNNLVYGKVTPEAIVMQLVVDDGFPDRPHRLAIFNRNHQNTGIACSEIPVYNNVCAIAYTRGAKARQPVAANTEETTENSSQPSTSPEVDTSTIEKTQSNPEATPTTSESDVIVTTKPVSESDTEVVNRNQTDNTNSTLSESEVTETPTIEEEQPKAITEFPAENNTDSESEVTETPTIEEEQSQEVITESPAENSVDSESEVTETPTEEEEQSQEVITQSPAENNIDSETTATTNETNLDVATSNANNPSQAVEIVERGTLEEGDDVIPNDGSFYDSYPIEVSAGESLIITLESEDFDTFLAIMDREGNIIEQNDDIGDRDSNSRLEITLPDDGTYSVIVNAYEEQGKGNYVLTVRR